jgi:hypothetical protein
MCVCVCVCVRVCVHLPTVIAAAGDAGTEMKETNTKINLYNRCVYTVI